MILPVEGTIVPGITLYQMIDISAIVSYRHRQG